MKNILKYSFIFLFMTSGYMVNAQIPISEKQYLIEFFKGTIGEQWQNTWNLKADPSSWYGVEIKTTLK